MSSVWVVIETHGDGDEVMCVYDSEEKAETHRREYTKKKKDHDIAMGHRTLWRVTVERHEVK